LLANLLNLLVILEGSVLISERGIYAASPFKAIRALKRAKARAPPQMGTLPFGITT
jgi:hypothetical protein